MSDHINALERYSRNRYLRLRLFPGRQNDIPDRLDLSRFDALVLHYTLVACYDSYVSPGLRARIRAFNGLKAMFIQDEYQFVDATVDAIRSMEIDLLFTCVPEESIEKVYPRHKLPDCRKINVLTGYVTADLVERKVPAFADRPIDVGYRGRTVPAWLGELGQEKWRIGARFAEEARAYGIVCDIGYREEDRLYGDAWIGFLTSCKASLGVESGSSVFDFTGDIKRQVEEHLSRYPNATYEELRDRYFKDLEGRIALNQISPRAFECAALRTLMILYEGDYSGILEPWRHYIPLKKDHSNMAEVVASLRNSALCEAIVRNAYQEVAQNEEYGFRRFVQRVDHAMADLFTPSMRKRGAAPTSAELDTCVKSWIRRKERRKKRQEQWAWVRQCAADLLYLCTIRIVFCWVKPETRGRMRRECGRVFRELLPEALERFRGSKPYQ
ncbi:MAG TPA: glycosyltransferase [Nitrospira sp.]|nr:glycosyltransferase [Nitrospira sp.]